MLKSENMLDLKYHHKSGQQWRVREDGIVELTMEHKGLFAAIAHKVFHRPKVSYIELDTFGSFVWQQLESTGDVTTISDAIYRKFGEAAEPVLPRLVRFITLLERYGFVEREKSGREV